MDSKPKPRIFYGWVIVGASCIILSVAWGCQYSYGIFLTELCADLDWARAMVSGAYSLFFVWHGILYFVSGSLNDRYGPRFTLMISGIVMAIGYALMSILNASWQLYVFYGIVIGSGMGFCYVPLTSTVSRWFVKRRGTALGITAAGVGLGTLILAPFAQFLISRFDWRVSYLILAGLVVVLVLPVSRLMRLDPSEKGLLPLGMEEIAPESQRRGDFSSIALDFSLKQATRAWQFWLLFVMYASLPFGVQMVMVHLKAYATDFGITPMVAATAVGLVGGSSILGRVAMGSVSDRIGRRAPFFVGGLLMGLMILWLLTARQPWQFYLFAALFGFGYGSWVPLFPAITADWFGTECHGSIFGVLSLGTGIGGGIGPLLAGYMSDTMGSYEMAFIAGAVVFFIAAGCSFVIKAPYAK